MKLSNASLIVLIKYLTWGISLFIFMYLFFIQLLHFVLPSQNYIDQYAFNLTWLRILLLLGFILAMVGWSLAYLEKKMFIISPFTLPWEEKIALIMSSILLAIFYNRVFVFLKIWQYPIFFLLLLIFLLIIPQIVNSYLQIKYVGIKYLFKLLLNYGKKLIHSSR